MKNMGIYTVEKNHHLLFTMIYQAKYLKNLFGLNIIKLQKMVQTQSFQMIE